MTFFGKPSGGPDGIGGLFPRKEDYAFMSRAGATVAKGGVFTLDLLASATEVSATDSNSALPGAGDTQGDSIWNTVVDPTAGQIAGTDAALFAVSLGGVATNNGHGDNAIAKCRVWGLVDQARVLASGNATNLVYGMPLTVTTTNSFNATITSNQRVVGWFAGPSQAVTNAAELGRVFIHNGVGFTGGFPATPIA